MGFPIELFFVVFGFSCLVFCTFWAAVVIYQWQYQMTKCMKGYTPSPRCEQTRETVINTPREELEMYERQSNGTETARSQGPERCQSAPPPYETPPPHYSNFAKEM